MITLSGARCTAVFETTDDAPVRLSSFAQTGCASLVSTHPIALVFTATEQHKSRLSHAYADSAIGERLRYRSHESFDDDNGSSLRIDQFDKVTGLVVRTVARVHSGTTAMSLSHEVINESGVRVVLTAISCATAGFTPSAHIDDAILTWGQSGWTTEHRWHETRLGDALAPLDVAEWGNDLATRFAVTSVGAWTTAEYLPTGVLSEADGSALAWQIEGSGPWHWEVARTRSGGYIAALGPTEVEHGFAVRLEPGASFMAPTATLAVSGSGRDGAFAALTDYRRAIRQRRDVDERMPVVYNDYMNTLMGDPTTAKLVPLISSAALAGAEYFCIDAGWFADDSGADWWNAVGEWEINEARFPGSLLAVIDLIRSSGMRPGIWLEPEVVGIQSTLAERLPVDAYFQRFGERVVTQDRYHLDLRHADARAHLDSTVDRLVRELGIEYFKLDYNINPGAGTTVDALSAGEGLLGHVRAHQDWLRAAQERHPEVLFENCASGAMRADYGLLSLAHQQSTSDQQDYLLYATIAAGAPASILPEQCANWAYPSEAMNLDETAFSLVAGIAGRLYLSGFLDRLRPEQFGLVQEAVAVSKAWRERIARSHPVWPLGMPDWNADQLAIAFDCGDEYLVAMWSRGAASAMTLVFASQLSEMEQLFPAAAATWVAAPNGRSLVVDFPAGPQARVMRITKAEAL